MMQPSHESLAAVVLLEAHRHVEDAAEAALATLTRLPATRPPASTDAATPDPSSLPPEDALQGMAVAIGELRRGTTLSYPPNEEGRLTDEELAALARLRLEPAARSALRKIVRDAASSPLFQLFCLLDAVGAPELTSVTPWLAVNLAPAKGDRPMMHDEFFDSYWSYLEKRTERREADGRDH
jgi:hypothetical protein